MKIGRHEALCEEMQRFRRMLTARGILWFDNSTDTMGEYAICRTGFEFEGSKYFVNHGYETLGGCRTSDGSCDLGLLEVISPALAHGNLGNLSADEAERLIFGKQI